MHNNKDSNTHSDPPSSKYTDEDFPIDKWEIVEGFDLLELENVYTDKSSLNSSNTWILCDSYLHSTPSNPNTSNSSKVQSNNIDKYMQESEYYSDSGSILSSNDSESQEEELGQSPASSCEILKVDRLSYNEKEDKEDKVNVKNRDLAKNVPELPESDLNDIQVESLKKFEEKLSKALYKVNFIENKTKNMLMEVSNSIGSLDELKTSSYRLKSNSGKFKSSCTAVMRYEQYEYYKYLIFIIFGAGVAIWLM